MEIKDAAGNSIRLKELDHNDPNFQRTITDFQNTSGTPRYYDVRGDSVYLYPAPATGSVTMTAGGRMFFSREVDAFTSADTTQEPGFAEPYHRIVSLGMSFDWLMVNGPREKATDARTEIEQLRSELREFYGSKNQESRVGFRPARDTRQYV